MAKDDKDIDEMMRRIDALRERRNLRSRDARTFTEELADINCQNHKRCSWWITIRTRITMAGEWMSQCVFRMVYGYSQPQMDEEGLLLLTILLNDGQISRNEWWRAVWQRIIRRGKDEILYSVGPGKRARLIGKLAGGLLVIGSSSIIVAILEDPFHLLSVLPWCVIAGMVIGLLVKHTYFVAWGHEALAKKLRYLCPIFRLQLD